MIIPTADRRRRPRPVMEDLPARVGTDALRRRFLSCRWQPSDGVLLNDLRRCSLPARKMVSSMSFSRSA